MIINKLKWRIMRQKRIEDLIDLSESLDLLNNIRKIKSCSLLLNEFSKNYKIILEPNNNGIKFTLFHDFSIFHIDTWDYRNVEIHKENLVVKIPYLYFTSKKFGQSSGTIPAFEYGNVNKSKVGFHRLILPINSKINFIFSIETVLINYDYQSNINSIEATEISIDEKLFHLFIAKKKVTELSDADYLVIQSKFKMSYSDFSDFCFSILISFGFVSGHFINNDGYFFQYESENMQVPIGIEYRQMRGSVKCKYVPIYSDPFGYIREKEKANYYKNKLRTLSLEEFSQLCQFCHSNNDLKTILISLIEVHNQTLISSPGILSIALETLANVIYDENENSLAPIKSKKISREIRKELKKVVDNFDEKIDKEGIKILKSRIDQINQRTNRDKLLIPFTILKIPISSSDIEAIEQRNAFLHGRVPMVKMIIPKSINNSDKFRYYLYLKLYVLVSSIILKYIGYDGMILNHPKIYENTTGIKLNEEHYRQI